MKVSSPLLVAVGADPANALEWLPALQAACDRYGINTPTRLPAFLAQTAHESNGFRTTTENLNYSLDGLLAIFGKHFSGRADAAQYAHNPEKIANRVYANRMGNGPENTGDGWKYRGRGLIQLTGKDVYERYSYATRNDGSLLADPNPVMLPADAALSAAWFWAVNNLNSLADAGNFRAITLRINGGVNGFDDRMKRWQAAKQVPMVEET